MWLDIIASNLPVSREAGAQTAGAKTGVKTRPGQASVMSERAQGRATAIQGQWKIVGPHGGCQFVVLAASARARHKNNNHYGGPDKQQTESPSNRMSGT